MKSRTYAIHFYICIMHLGFILIIEFFACLFHIYQCLDLSALAEVNAEKWFEIMVVITCCFYIFPSKWFYQSLINILLHVYTYQILIELCWFLVLDTIIQRSKSFHLKTKWMFWKLFFYILLLHYCPMCKVELISNSNCLPHNNLNVPFLT